MVRVFLLRLALSLAMIGGLYLVIPATGTRAAAPYIAVETNCNGGTSNANFTWYGNDPYALVQYLDLSLSDNGFAPGTFFSAGPLGATQNSVTLAQIRPGAPHFVRVNQQLWTGDWDPSPTFAFYSAGCGGPLVSGGGSGSGPVRIDSLTCRSSQSTATLTNVVPASSQTSSLNAAPFETIQCQASVSGAYTSLAWRGPNNEGFGPTFAASIGGPRPGGAPYTISLQVNWGGNPAIANVAVYAVAPAFPTYGCYYLGMALVCP
jgi:hypothetical protein